MKWSLRFYHKKAHAVLSTRWVTKWATGTKTPEGICLAAFNTLFPSLRVLRFGGSFPWETDPDVTTVACPDAQNPVVFELTRLQK